MASYNLFFTGQVLPGREVAQVRQDLARLLRLDDAQVARLFSGNKVLVKRSLSEQDLGRYEAAFRRAGAQVLVEEVPGADSLTLEPVAPPAPASSSPDPYGVPQDGLVAGRVFCRGCGQPIHETAIQCPHCGARQESGTPRSKVVAGVLAILLGWIGTHRLYLGQWWGVFYIFLPLSSLVALIEGIVFLATPESRWNERYGRVQSNMVWLVIPMLIVGIMVTGILAAVAIPAYQDYTVRSKVAESLSQLQGPRDEVEDFVDRVGMLPDSNAMLGWPADRQLENGDSVTLNERGQLVLTFNRDGAINGQTLMLTPALAGGQVSDWECGQGTLATRYRPASCRNGLAQAEPAKTPASDGRTVAPESGDYQVTVPSHWSRLRELEDNATEFSWGNKFLDQYLLVMYEPSDDYHDEADHRLIAEAFLDNMQYSIEGANWTPLESTVVAGYPASAFDLHGQIDGLDISYRGATVRTEERVYFVLCWTSTASFGGFRDTCDQVIDSMALAGAASRAP